MDPQARLLKETFGIAHMVFNAVTGDMTDEQCEFEVGGTVPRAAAIFAHAVYGEDMVVNQMVRGTETVLVRGGFLAKTGIDKPSPGMSPDFLAMTFNIAGLREYAAAVFAETSQFLDVATTAELEREIDTPLGTKMPAGAAMGAFGVVHVSEHAGEISALKGAQGGKGLPF